MVLIRPIKFWNAKIPSTPNGQMTPSQKQLKKIMQAGTMTSRVCIVLVSEPGVRLEVLVSPRALKGSGLETYRI